MKTNILKRKSTPRELLSYRTDKLAPSLIREISEQAYGIPDIIPLWFGEGCWPTSEIAIQAVNQALADNDHFYQPNSGKLNLRQEICDYYERVYDLQITLPNITVTASGMNGLALVAQALISPRDRVVAIEPSWPNIAETFRISGAEISVISLQTNNGKWELDLDKFLSLITSNTKAVLINSPNNPTGWTMSSEDQKRVLEHCRRTETWIVADDVYSRLCYNGSYAPNFLHICEPDDLVISVNSFSKAWSMTGWRLGWITAPKELESVFAMLTEFNIAGPSGFIQAAGAKILKDGEGEVKKLQGRLSAALNLTEKRLRKIPNISFVKPEGAFYSLFRVDGVEDSLQLAKDLCLKAKVGLAPGIAFGPDGEGCLRLCYAQPLNVLDSAFDRLENYFSSL
ncbi:MAG: pyridoxal phosphate-dependent aminotransferase [Paracoccaceae bacterium]